METDLNRKPDLEHERHRALEAEAVAERSKELFDSGMYCAESVLQAVAEAYGMMDSLIPKIATGFCGGISRTSGMCGALAGGVLALGLLTGRSSPQDSKDCCYALTHNLVQRFRERFGSTQCADLLGCNISTVDGATSFRANVLEKTICGPVTRQAAGLVEEVYALRSTIRHPLL
jgi:C_GCAxxG_C_C family probable redox protein